LFLAARHINQMKADISELLNRAACVPFSRNGVTALGDLKNQMLSERGLIFDRRNEVQKTHYHP
jgi:hypothetical protein